jgi:hypothetical protein
MGWILMAAGLFSISGAVMDWDWFMENRKAKLWTTLFGRNGARIFYGILGVAIVIAGVLMTTGVISE